jgi:hypothetical protein
MLQHPEIKERQRGKADPRLVFTCDGVATLLAKHETGGLNLRVLFHAGDYDFTIAKDPPGLSMRLSGRLAKETEAT